MGCGGRVGWFYYKGFTWIKRVWRKNTKKCMRVCLKIQDQIHTYKSGLVICQGDIYQPQNWDICPVHLPGGQLPPPIFSGLLFFAFSTYSSWRTSRMGRRRCLMRWSWNGMPRKSAILIGKSADWWLSGWHPNFSAGATRAPVQLLPPWWLSPMNKYLFHLAALVQCSIENDQNLELHNTSLFILGCPSLLSV